MKTLLMLTVASSMLGSGCAFLRPDPPPPRLPAGLPVPEMERQPGDFALHVRVMDMPASQKNLLYSNADLYADRTLQDPETESVPLPVFYLKPGETREADLRQSAAYPSQFDEKGDAVEYLADVVGSLGKAKLMRDEKGAMSVELHIEHFEPVFMRSFATPAGKEYSRPVSNKVAVEVKGSIPQMNTWLVLSGGSKDVQKYAISDTGMQEARTATVWRVVLVKLVPPQ